MPYKDPTKLAEQQQVKWRLWREIGDGFALKSVCSECQLDIYSIDPDRDSVWGDRWYHFCDPVALGFRPWGKNDPVYDLVRQCATAIDHRYLPEGVLDPRWGASQDLKNLIAEKKSGLHQRATAIPVE